jgi:hypothetical protein
MAVSQFSLNRFRWVADPDDALDMTYDYENGDDYLDDDYDDGEDWTP